MMKRLFPVIAITGVSALALGGCSAAGTADGPVIGVVFYDEAAPNTAPIREAMHEVADARGAQLITTDAKGDTSVELTEVENLITRGVDAIVMQPIDGETSQRAAKLVNDANLPLFTVNTAFPEDAEVDITSYIGQDETEAGRAQAEYMNEQLPDGGSILFIAGTYGASWTDRRRTGFDEAINANFNIAFEFQADCSRDKAKRSTEDALQRFPAGSLVGAVAQCDETAIGTALAIEESERDADFTAFVSVDGDPAGLEAVQEGIVTATMAQDFTGQGETAANVVLDALEGKSVDPVYARLATLITADNVGDYLN